MSAMQHIPTWQYIAVVTFTWLTGFLAGAALFYPTSRRHGIEALEDEVAKIARKAGAKVRGDN